MVGDSQITLTVSETHFTCDTVDRGLWLAILKALANEDTLLLPHLPARATFVADTNFVSGTQKCF